MPLVLSREPQNCKPQQSIQGFGSLATNLRIANLNLSSSKSSSQSLPAGFEQAAEPRHHSLWARDPRIATNHRIANLNLSSRVSNSQSLPGGFEQAVEPHHPSLWARDPQPARAQKVAQPDLSSMACCVAARALHVAADVRAWPWFGC
jgi:hypothetical protein